MESSDKKLLWKDSMVKTKTKAINQDFISMLHWCYWAIIGVLSGCGAPDCYDEFIAIHSSPSIDSINLTLISVHGDKDTLWLRGENERIYSALFSSTEPSIAKWMPKTLQFEMRDTLFCYRCLFDFAISELHVDSADPTMAQTEIRIEEPYFVALPAVLKSNANLLSTLSDANAISYSVEANDESYGHFSFRDTVEIHRENRCPAW